MTHSSVSSRPPKTTHLPLAAADSSGLVELRAGSPLIAQVWPTGALFALRHESTLLNQLLTGPAEDGLFRLLLRWRTPRAKAYSFAPLVGSGLGFSRATTAAARWISSPAPGLHAETYLQIHPTQSGWSWRVRVRNDTTTTLAVDALHAQDLGLADEGAVRNNEAYTSQYLDLLPIRDPAHGWTILARQNQTMAKGRHPWLAVACTSGAAGFCTDGRQFFGADYRLTGEPECVRNADLPSQRLQQEFAMAGLQSRALELKPGEAGELRFVARFVADHPEASSSAGLKLLKRLVDPTWDKVSWRSTRFLKRTPVSLFTSASWLHGDVPTDADCAKWFPGDHRQEERSPDGLLLSFFADRDTHVVTRTKEATVARPHGHILRSGDGRWFDAGHFGTTCYAAGIFSAQAYLGHPSFARLLSVVRNALNVVRSSGQRIFVQHRGRWRQLGIPSTFAMTPGDARWTYRVDRDVIEVRAWCDRSLPYAHLNLTIQRGAPRKFLITHNVVLDAAEFDHSGAVTLHASEAWIGAQPSADSMVGRHEPGLCFAIAASDPAQFDAIAGDSLLYADKRERGGAYVSLRTKAVSRFGVILLGTHEGAGALPAAVASARTVHAKATGDARPPAPPAQLFHANDDRVSRINEILPWYAHNAAIHFSAPHGLEQYGGAAWGVRDVCQGSLEWLLASGEFPVARRMLETVFAQQYSHEGSWPQWFMHPPYQTVQQAHSHGDVCFWPVKALCDYVEASNDVDFLRTPLRYTDHETFRAEGLVETILQHTDRVVAQCEARFIAGTALVNYGDGDWDDTLQPADPTMRTHMTSAWTVGLAFHTFRQLATVCRRVGDRTRAVRLEQLCARMRGDFGKLMPGGIVAGFGIQEKDGSLRPLLHPEDTVTHIRFRLLPMTRSILAELFTPAEAKRHLEIIAKELRYPDGVRLMSEPSTYQGGVERLFKRAETAANVGREIGLQYVHAHLRYAEALAKVGDAEGFWHALQVVNPVGLSAIVPHAAPRQSNTYFSSSDADFPDRYEAATRWEELRTGQVAVCGGWRLYSSGPGIFIRIVRSCLLGLRESFDGVVFDPVLPLTLNGLTATATLLGRPVEIVYHVTSRTSAPRVITVNGTPLTTAAREKNPYRVGGLRVPTDRLKGLLSSAPNRIEVEL
ncbi:MAG: amylo-alpha-1,6-glucosidase [Opitutus sp.]